MEQSNTKELPSHVLWISQSEHIVSFHKVESDDYELLVFPDQREKAIVMILTYVVCYAMMNLCLPILVFGAACIIFCLLYSIAASILVYKFAPQTFRLRT